MLSISQALGRVAAIGLGAGLGLVLGAIFGSMAGAPVGSSGWSTVWATLGAVLVLLAITLRDRWRAARVLSWLRQHSDEPAPSMPGPWGDLAYQAEKAIRLRERTLAAARQEHAQFIQAFEATPNGVLLLDDRQHVVWCNRVAADHLGLDPERDLQQLITNLVRQPAFVQYLQDGVQDEPLIMPSPRHHGTLSIVLRRASQDRQLLLMQDISALEKADEMRRAFVAHVSHEIRTPLTVIGGFLETMQTLDLDPPQRQRILGLMEQQSQRMSSLVADLLVLARLEGSPRPPLDRWVSLDRLVAQVTDEARVVSAGRHELSVSEGPGVELAGQESELHSAIGNLVQNAIRYTPQGGRISMALALDDQGRALVHVRDTGIGIDREHIPRLTQRFYRVDPSRSRETGGTGLGLAIVKHAIQRHGGELLIDSEPGSGSQFTLRFPAARVRRVPV